MRRTVLAALLIFVSASVALACGKERWAVKTGTDQDVAQVAAIAQASTVAALAAIPAPPDPNARYNTRFAPTELTPYVVSGILTVIKRETDEDYHLVIADPDTGDTMIVESPNPHCAEGSRFLDGITEVRQAIDAEFGPIKRKRHPNIPVTVIGVAFFDPLHGQEGVAPNGIELHPLLSILFD